MRRRAKKLFIFWKFLLKYRFPLSFADVSDTLIPPLSCWIDIAQRLISRISKQEERKKNDCLVKNITKWSSNHTLLQMLSAPIDSIDGRRVYLAAKLFTIVEYLKCSFCRYIGLFMSSSTFSTRTFFTGSLTALVLGWKKRNKRIDFLWEITIFFYYIFLKQLLKCEKPTGTCVGVQKS